MATRRSESHDPSERPSVARVYDYLLGGFQNFPSDREAAEKAIALYPDFPLVTQANRAFLRRVVTFLLEQGITQFLDLGSGIPTVGNVHEVAQAANPQARVVYVDHDPVAVAHSRSLLRDNPHAMIVQADVRAPDDILRHPDVQRLIEWDKPLAVLLLAILHFVLDNAEARHIVQTFRDAMPAGSYMAISHGTEEGVAEHNVHQLTELYNRTTAPMRPRSRAEIASFFDGLELVEPGVVYAPLWRPEDPDDLFLDQPERAIVFAGVGKKKDGTLRA